jgi:LemA protein
MGVIPQLAQTTVTGPAVAVAVGCGVAIGAGVWVVVAYNRLVRRRNLVAEGYSGIDVQLKRRHDLVPNLVACVKGYAGFERSLLEDITRLRTAAGADTAIGDRKTHENALTDRLKTLFALAEAYPDLKANKNFAQLSTQLVEIEDGLQYARRYYNGTVRDYNIAVESFPSRLVAGAFGYQGAEFFEVETVNEREAPSVRFDAGVRV